MGKSHRKKKFVWVYPLLVLRPDLDSSQDSGQVSRGIFQKKTKIGEVIEGKSFLRFGL
jgi:hypothetical protein